MCTCITLKSEKKDFLMARTMDFSFQLDPEFVVFPRKFPLNFTYYEEKNEEHFAFMGLAKNLGSYYCADGVNEKGLSIAALYFEGYAIYDSEPIINKSLAPHEVVMYILAKCQNIKEVKKVFLNQKIVETHLELVGSTPPLHWIVQDIEGKSIIVEKTKNGINIFENKLGVLTNSPDYNWHHTNVRNYIGLTPNAAKPRVIYGDEFKPFGQGSGTFGIPGDLTPPSRFIRALYSKLSVKKADNDQELVVNAMHILNSVDIPKGSVITQRMTMDYTQYTSYIVNNKKEYYYRLYDGFAVVKHCLNDFDLDAKTIIKNNS